MRFRVALLLAVALVLSTTSCGSAQKRSGPPVPGQSSESRTDGATSTPPSGASARPRPKRDGDGDADNLSGSYYDSDDEAIRVFGQAASAADTRTIIRLVKRYYAAAATANGDVGCRLMYPVLAELVAEEYGQSAALRGKTCPVVLSKLFKQHQEQTRAKNRSLTISDVRVEGEHGYAMLGPPGVQPKRYIGVKQEHGVWKINESLDASLP
jgi:hypothetical protein